MDHAASSAAPAAPATSTTPTTHRSENEVIKEKVLRPSFLAARDYVPADYQSNGASQSEAVTDSVPLKSEYCDDEFEGYGHRYSEHSEAFSGYVPVKAEPTHGFSGYVPQNAIRDTDMADEAQGPCDYSFLIETVSLEERVAAFDKFEEERLRIVTLWQTKKKPCEQCGKFHAPPHFTKEQQSFDFKALKKGRQLRHQLQRQGNNAPKKEKSVFCKTCKKYHPGGAPACRTPLCPKGCKLNHFAKEDCADAAKRFAKVEETQQGKRKGPAPAPAPGGLDATFSDFHQKLRHTSAVLGSAADLLGILTGEKRPAGESAEKTHSTDKKQKTGRANSCQPPKQPHRGSNKPDGKGKGRGRPTQA